VNGEPGAPRQRWRLVVRVPASSFPGERPSGVRGWSDALLAAGLPIAMGPGGRGPRVTPAAALPLGVSGEREIVDLYLAERLPIADLRSRLDAALPAGVVLVDLHDVWLGAAAAPAAVRAAEYRVEAAGAPEAAVRAAVASLLAAPSLPRERRREKRTVSYDLRPLVERLEVSGWEDAPAGGPAGTLWMRLRHGPETAGRPEEVLAAVAELVGSRLDLRSIARDRLVLEDEPGGHARG
jgi:radical SAM-linked protein